MNLAEETLRHAEGNRNISAYRPAVSLAYYAAFYAAKAVIAYHREGPKTHRGAGERFRALAVRDSDFPPEIAPILARLMKSRDEADYDQATSDWGDADASEAIADARTFVREVVAWFDRHVPADEQD